MIRVYDVSTDTPTKDDRVFVDTNIWVFLTHPAATIGLSPKRQAQVDVYLKYFELLRNSGCNIVSYVTTAFELANAIEKTEYRVACNADSVQPNSVGNKLKDYRTRATFRTAVANAVADSWLDIRSQSEVKDANLTVPLCEDALAAASRWMIDITDALHVQLMRGAGIDSVLSDDADFLSVDHPLTLLTNNARAINQATADGRLARR